MNSTEKMELGEKHLLRLPFPHVDNRYFLFHFSLDGETDSLCYVTHKKPTTIKHIVLVCMCVYVCVCAEQVQLVISAGKSKRCWVGPDLRAVTHSRTHWQAHSHKHTPDCKSLQRHIGNSAASITLSCYFTTTPFHDSSAWWKDGNTCCVCVCVCVCLCVSYTCMG